MGDKLKVALSNAHDDADYDPRTIYFNCGETKDLSLEQTVRRIAKEQGKVVLSAYWIKVPHIVGNHTWALAIRVRKRGLYE